MRFMPAVSFVPVADIKIKKQRIFPSENGVARNVVLSMTEISMPQKIFWQKDYDKSHKLLDIGQGLSEFTPVEIVGYEV